MTAFKSTFITPYTIAPFSGMTNMVVDNSSFDGRSYSFEFNNAHVPLHGQLFEFQHQRS